MADIGDTGVDELSSMIFGYDSGQMAVLSCAVKAKGQNEAFISGTKGTVKIPDFWSATEIVYQPNDKEPEIIKMPLQNPNTGLDYQAMAVMDCIRKGEMESNIMPLSESLEIMQTMESFPYFLT